MSDGWLVSRLPTIMGGVPVLPVGWDLARVQSIEPSAVLLDESAHVAFVADANSIEELPPPRCVLSFSGLCLVQVENDDDWWMGQLDESERLDRVLERLRVGP